MGRHSKGKHHQAAYRPLVNGRDPHPTLPLPVFNAEDTQPITFPATAFPAMGTVIGTDDWVHPDEWARQHSRMGADQ